MSSIKKLLLIPHINVHNANALSSPFTIGFPAMTAWLGATHALQRKLNQNGYPNAKFNATGVISHDCQLQTFKGIDDFVHSIVGTGNPLDKSGSRSAFIEEARCHLDISLVIDFQGVDKTDEERFINQVEKLLHSNMKMAAGDILSFKQPSIYRIEQGDDVALKQLTRKFMPGYALIERRDLLKEAMNDGEDVMQAIIDYLAIHHTCEQSDDERITWSSHRKSAGWIVPIATGFQGISELGKAKNQRDSDTPHRFAEAVVTLGEFKMPHRMNSIEQILWQYHTDLNNDLYLCQAVN